MDSILLKNWIPIVPYYSVEILSKSERQLSKFFKCCPKESFESNNKCFWSGNNGQEFKKHVQTCHQYVFCSYCLSDKTSNDEIKPFATEDVDQLISHMIEIHGRRLFQCNRCQYRANTSTHIQLHQISIHYHIWSKNNLKIKCDSLDDNNTDICKIIDCKPINSRVTDHSLLMQKFSPNLDSDLEENLFYCLYCGFSNEESMKVFMHCVHKHRDYEISVYKKECPEKYCFDDSEPEEVIESDESDFDELIDKPIIVAKSLVNNFETKLSFHSQPIPGIDESVAPFQRPPERPFRPRHERCSKKFENRFQKRGKKRKESFDTFYADDFEDNFPTYDSYEEPSAAMPTIQRPFVIDRQPTAIPSSIELIATPQQQHITIPSTQQNLRQPSLQQKKKNKWQKYLNIKSNEKPSSMTYGQWKEQQKQKKALLAPNLTSTPNPNKSAPPIETQIPPEIDLQQTEEELGFGSNESKFRKNSFKQINRIGVSIDKINKSKAVTYVPRGEEDETDGYLNLLNESKIAKRGVKARFETQTHFELISLQSRNNPFNGKHLYKCVVCVNETQLRENNINIHLKSVHKTDSSLKCGYCDYIGQRALIKSHSDVVHPGADLKVEKFIVHITQNSSIGFTSGSNLERPKTTARKSTGGASQTVKGSKGALTRMIRESTYLGPLKNDVTQRKLTDEPFQRKYSRSVHSSNIQSKKRQKLNISDSESEAEMQTENNIRSDLEPLEPLSDVEMYSDIEYAVEQNESDNEEIVEMPKTKVVSVAKKSTAKPSSQDVSQVSITLTEEQIPTKYFCVFCTESFIINDKSEAIEHYKRHLKLGYTCKKCHQFFVSYDSAEFHWTKVHSTHPDMDLEENMSVTIREWIVGFLDGQIKSADFAETIVPNSTGINIMCPLCVKAAKICNSVRPRAFDALWKVKLHICKHLNWFPMNCNLCDESDTMFPQNPYLLMKHLVDCHFTSCENLYNISFRGQKPFNDMKREQMRLIDKNFSSVTVVSSDIINSFFYQLMTELDLNYENQLKAKYNLTKEIQVKVERLIQVKNEPIDLVDAEESDQKTEVKDEDKKDIKLNIKTELKTEIKSEIKNEFKFEVKTETKDELKERIKKETENSDDLKASSDHFLSRLYGDDVIQMNPIPLRPSDSSKDIEEIVLLSDDES